jgi:copper homeostasis protein
MIPLEICINCDSKQSVPDSVGAAYSGGASRIELCSSMDLGGLTPEVDQILSARKVFGEVPGLMVMVRPRPGNFVYSPLEVQKMIEQIHFSAEAGADGIVIGVLENSENRIDTDLLYRFLNIISQYNLSTTFHRAFDATPDPLKSIESLIELEVDRVLTSGTMWGNKGTALEGIEMLKQVVQKSKGKIEIVVGGGINSKNVNQILRNLPLPGNKISIHSYSGVQKDGFTDFQLIKSLMNQVNAIDN